MQSYEVLRQALENANPKEVASEMGVSLSLVYKWSQPTEENGSGTTNPLDRVEQLYRITKDDAVVQWLCRVAGGFFVKNSRSEKVGDELVPATQLIVQRFAELLTAISTAAVDQEISPAEAKKIRGEWDDLKRFTEGFVRCCENGDFEGAAKGLGGERK
jgi:hypothetical protein